MLKKIFVLIIMLTTFISFSQNKDTKKDEDNDKYSVKNVMLYQVIECSEGLILKYFSNNQLMTAYVPNKFFKEQIAVRIEENDTRISPQMSIVYKNFKPFKVKLYLARYESSMTYRFMDMLTPDTIEKFRKTEELTFPF